MRFVTASRWRQPQPTHLLTPLHGKTCHVIGAPNRHPRLKGDQSRHTVQNGTSLQAAVCPPCPVRETENESSTLEACFSSSSICPLISQGDRSPLHPGSWQPGVGELTRAKKASLSSASSLL